MNASKGEQEFNEFCAALPATSDVNHWRGTHVWKVGGKMFAIGGRDKAGQLAFAFRTSERDVYLSSTERGFRPPPCLASRGMTWIRLDDASNANVDELQPHLRES